ncbi:MAG: TIGR04282 family arsenosugar biosynthesis glycosyltransferase [Gemmatimonadota bacterium]|nr:TIGR04282 family arsenosugar biosynthesis glycosyltransferase [Gemmatimonadota bacterium]
MDLSSPPGDVLAIFVKSPEPGQVKTRLANEIGPETAATLYRKLGRAVVADNVATGRHRTVVWFAPPDQGNQVRSWLSGLPVDEFNAQHGGGLGRRMMGTFRRHLREGARRVVLIGSDCPDVDRAFVRRAFDALDQSDLVLGPSQDGGFYLIGLTAPVPGLFRRVAWSTPAVLAQTIRNAARLGLRVATLPMLRDIDTVEDALALGWLSLARSQ